MLELVTIEEARHQLRLDEPGSDGGPDDAWLSIFIPAVSEAVASWLKDRWRLYLPERDSHGDIVYDSDGNQVAATDSNGDQIVHPIVRAAVLVELASQYRFREGEGERMESLGAIVLAGAHGYTLSKTATLILTGLRKPTVA